jgi:hypothetical protein
MPRATDIFLEISWAMAGNNDQPSTTMAKKIICRSHLIAPARGLIPFERRCWAIAGPYSKAKPAGLTTCARAKLLRIAKRIDRRLKFGRSLNVIASGAIGRVAP